LFRSLIRSLRNGNASLTVVNAEKLASKDWRHIDECIPEENSNLIQSSRKKKPAKDKKKFRRTWLLLTPGVWAAS
jgi:hypothetical protein